MDENQERCNKITDIINKRDVERKLDIEKKREDKRLGLADNENIEVFEKAFLNERLEIEHLLHSCMGMDASKLPERFNEVSKKILSLQKYVAASNIFLRSYDIKRFQESLQNLGGEAKDLEEQLFPKKKFGFKKKSKAEKIIQPKDEVDFTRKSVISTYNCEFENRRNEVLVLDSDRINKKDIMIRNLDFCVIKLFGNPTTLHMSCLNGCTVLSGPISTSVFAENCKNCKLVISCQQLRLHSSTEVDVYLHVTSRAIMEDCNKISLAPYNLKYKEIEGDYELSGLSQSVNNWQCVDDFNWLNIEVPSPNWTILNENERVKDWVDFALPVG